MGALTRQPLLLLAILFSIVGLAAGLLLEDWLVATLSVAFARALAVLGLIVLWRTGLVSFGHALYFGIGAYTVAILGIQFELSELLITLPAAAIAGGLVGWALGFIVRRYREIFFAMLSLAFSMVLYGVLVKSEALGSTDGFNVLPATLFGWRPEEAGDAQLMMLLVLCVLGWGAAGAVHLYLNSTLGSLTSAIRDNEIRVEYLGASVAQAIHIKYVISAVLAALAGGATATILGQVDPDSMVNWPISGELVFVTILSGSGNVIAPFIGSVIYELIRTYAFEWAPHAWQMIVGATLLAIIFLLPGGVWSLIEKLFKRSQSRG